MSLRTCLSAVMVLGIAAAIGGSAQADPVTPVFTLGAPTVSGNIVDFTVSIDFGADPNLSMVFFGIDVSPSSPELTGGGTDFSAFSFTPNSPLLDDWNLVQDFGSPIAPGTVQYDTIFGPLPPGTYLLGTLSLNLSVAGVGLDPALFVSIEGINTEIGAEDEADPSTFDFYPGTFRIGRRNLVPAAIPEPGTACLALIGGGLMCGLGWRARRPRIEASRG